MGPGLAIPVTCAPIQEPSTPTRVSFGVSPMSLRPITPPSVSLAHAPNRKPSTPMRVSAGVLPIPIQRTPPRTLVSRGVSPIPLEDLIPTEFASIFYTQLQTQVPGIVTLPALPTSPTHSPAWLNVISATESETEEERPLIQARNRAHSPEIVPDSQLLRREAWLRREAYMVSTVFPLVSRIHSLNFTF